MHISVQQATFDLGAQVNDFTSALDASGAVVTFTGIVRDLRSEEHTSELQSR